MIPPPPPSTLFPYTTLFRSSIGQSVNFEVFNWLLSDASIVLKKAMELGVVVTEESKLTSVGRELCVGMRSEEHTSELQSRRDLVCRLLLEKKNQDIAAGVGT